jgi:hypothetical protein
MYNGISSMLISVSGNGGAAGGGGTNGDDDKEYEPLVMELERNRGDRIESDSDLLDEGDDDKRALPISNRLLGEAGCCTNIGADADDNNDDEVGSEEPNTGVGGDDEADRAVAMIGIDEAEE